MSKSELTRPAGAVVPVTKSDTVDIVPPPNGGYELPCRALWVGTAGTATIIDGTGATRTDVPLIVGPNPFQVRRVLTGGTASDIWALF